jgi:diguanylate cyclase (GGDEF)-like protein/PAS domain S-box-containing protein
MSDSGDRRFELLRICCQISAVAVMALACLVLCGWAIHNPYLMSVIPGLVTMKANTATGLALSAISLWLLLPDESHKATVRIARLLALMVALIGASTLGEYLFRVNLGIDELLLRDPAGSTGTSAPGRLSPMTATAFIAIGLALILLDWETRRGRRPSQVLSLWAGFTAMLAISGYLFHATALTRILMYTQVAVHTAIGLFLLSIAIFLARPRSGIAGDLTRDGSGSSMARRLLPAVFLVPACLGWIRLQGQLAGLYGTEMGLTLNVTSNVVVFAVLVWWTARKLNQEFDHRSSAEAGVRKLNAELEERVAERTRSLEQQTGVLAEQAALLDLANDSIHVRDMNGRITFWNQGAVREYGWTAEQALGRVMHELLHTELPAPLDQVNAELLSKGLWEGELVNTRADQSRLSVSSRWALLRDAHGNPRAVLEINSDITESKQAKEALWTEKERAQVTLNSIGDAVICTDAADIITFLNPVAEQMTGWPSHEASGRPMAEVVRIVDATTREVIANPTKTAFGQDRAMHLPPNSILIRRDGYEIPIEDSVAPIHNREGQATGAVIVFRDVSAARAMAEQIAHLAEHDFLTGLPNRMLLNDRITQAIALAPRHGKKVALMFLDLDGFKQINDSLGHLAGDKLLQSIAKRLQSCVRRTDTVCRHGGDEFVVLFSEVQGTDNVETLAQQILASVAQSHSIDSHNLHVTGSVGISIYPDDGADAAALLENADAAMYQAKENGRQGYKFFALAMTVPGARMPFVEESSRRSVKRG